MLQSFFKNKITDFLIHSRIPLMKRLSRSLERDKAFPIQGLMFKAFVFYRSMLMSRFYLSRCDRVGHQARTRRKPVIDNTGYIEIGNNFNIISRNIRSVLRTGSGGYISIGDDVFMNFGSTVAARDSVIIGSRVAIGNYSLITDSDYFDHEDMHREAPAVKIIIEDEVWLAARVIVLKGAFIGKGSVIAAGSVVTGYIPPNVVAGGIPARIIRKIEKPDGKSVGNNRNPVLDHIPDSMVRHVRSEFADIVGYQGNVSFKDTPSDIPGWTAVNHIRLVEALEERFNIRIEEHEIIRLTSFGKICSLIFQRSIVSGKNSVTTYISG